jgi:dTDP-4-dehydrorhamnose 3,5-epimerase
MEAERLEDKRGFSARTWCLKEFQEHDLNPLLVQCNISFNRKRGTPRGMHYRAQPYEEARLVRCTAGAVYDVIIDLSPDSATYRAMDRSRIFRSLLGSHLAGCCPH